jgi:hypothetical protein
LEATVPTLEQLSDRAELTDLVARLGEWLDGGAEGDAGDLLVDEVTAQTPGGAAEGRAAVVAQARPITTSRPCTRSRTSSRIRTATRRRSARRSP